MIEGFGRRSTGRLAAGIAALATCGTFAALAATAALADPPPALFAGGTNGIVFAHGAHGNPHHGSSPQLTNHGGNVMSSGADVTPIFWGSSWTDTNTKVTGIDSFYAGVGGTAYAHTNGEYTGASGPVSTVVSSRTHLLDTDAASSGAPSTGQVLAIVAAKIGNNAVANGYYPVYSDQKRGHAGYCAWHSWGTIGTTPVQFAFFFNLDDDAGCDPVDTQSGHIQGLAALGNVSGHELSEALTDPRGAGWFDQAGDENADKCAWTFSGNLAQFSNGTQWKIQGNWSNAAYGTGLSYRGTSSGCIDHSS
jgi:hypothetical protein